MSAKQRYTQLLYMANRAFSSPLEALYTLLIFILGKELDASALQFTILAACKPVVSLLSFHLNFFIIGKPHRIRNFLLVASIGSALPCFLFPFVNNPWFYIASYALFMTLLRASFPAWVEILKNNLGMEGESIASTVAKGSSINYFIVILVPVFLSGWMDSDRHIWKSLFFVLAGLQLLNVVILSFLKLEFDSTAARSDYPSTESMVNPWAQWIESWNLFKENPYFIRYHLLFFLGGCRISYFTAYPAYLF